MAVFLRFFIGIVFLASGFEKVIHPYQNFLYVLQAYQLFPSGIEKLVAISVPWLELIVGVFLILGLWLDWSLKGALLFFACFIAIVGQALVRHLPLDECGCFGDAIHILPQYIIIFDSMMFGCALWLTQNLSKVRVFSLDQWFNSTEPQKP